MQKLIEKAKHIRLAIFDVDGILTSGTLFYDINGAELKDFHAHDGQGMKNLQQNGIAIAIITARQSEAVSQRMRDLGVQHVYQGQHAKLSAYEELKQKLQLTDQQISYMGDDLPDLPILRRAGLAVTVANAPQIIRDHVALITQAPGGKGAVRELCDFILQAQNTYQSTVDTYLI